MMVLYVDHSLQKASPMLNDSLFLEPQALFCNSLPTSMQHYLLLSCDLLTALHLPNSYNGFVLLRISSNSQVILDPYLVSLPSQQLLIAFVLCLCQKLLSLSIPINSLTREFNNTNALFFDCHCNRVQWQSTQFPNHLNLAADDFRPDTLKCVWNNLLGSWN